MTWTSIPLWSRQVVTENAGLKGALNKIAFTYPLSPHIHEMTTIETPATDAYLTEVRAQGVEMFAAHCQKRHGEMMKSEPNEAVRNEAITATRRAGEFALYFAAQLRQGAE